MKVDIRMFSEDNTSKPKNFRIAIVCTIVVIAVIILIIFLGLGGLGGSSGIKLTVDGSSYSVAINYVDEYGQHVSSFQKSGHFEWSEKGATSVTMIVFGTPSVTVKAFVNGELIQMQSGSPYAQVSASI